MKLRERIMVLHERIDSFIKDNGLMSLDEKVTFDFVRSSMPHIDKETARRFTKIIESLNKTREIEAFMEEIRVGEVASVFNSINGIIMEYINNNGGAPDGTPAKLINAALIVEQHNQNRQLNTLEKTHGR